jgi:hypothetical protein
MRGAAICDQMTKTPLNDAYFVIFTIPCQMMGMIWPSARKWCQRARPGDAAAYHDGPLVPADHYVCIDVACIFDDEAHFKTLLEPDQVKDAKTPLTAALPFFALTIIHRPVVAVKVHGYTNFTATFTNPDYKLHKDAWTIDLRAGLTWTTVPEHCFKTRPTLEEEQREIEK